MGHRIVLPVHGMVSTRSGYEPYRQGSSQSKGTKVETKDFKAILSSELKKYDEAIRK